MSAKNVSTANQTGLAEVRVPDYQCSLELFPSVCSLANVDLSTLTFSCRKLIFNLF